MIKFTIVCPHCGEEWWDKHECEGTRRADAEKAAENNRLAAQKRALDLEAKLHRTSRIHQFDDLPNEMVPFRVKTQPFDWGSRGARSSELMAHYKVKIDDAVNSPKHYTSHPSGVECIDVTKHFNFQIGNAMKYLWRQGLKNEAASVPAEKQIQDCEKAIWYIQSFITDLKGE